EVRSTRSCFFVPTSPNFHSILSNSLYLTLGECRSQSTILAPLASCTCPQTANRGLMRHRACLRASQPAGPRAGESSQWYFGGVCVMTMSESKGIWSHSRSASSGPYPKAHNPLLGEYGEPKTLN